MTRFNPDINVGLTKEQVEQRKAEGLVNYNNQPKTKTIPQIIRGNFLTYFNFLNLILGIAVFVAGVLNNNVLNALKNCLFMMVIIINSIISTIEEIISKKIIDKLSVISESKVHIIRDGKKITTNLEEIVLDDIIELSAGNQIVTDAIIEDGDIEVNESFITGESDSIAKHKGDMLLSGSFVVSGTCRAKVEHIGKDNYVSTISSEAKYEKKVNSVIMNSFEKLLKILSVAIIPIGIIMYITQFHATHGNIQQSIFTTVAALIGMIPEGLVLLTSSVMAVSVIKLYRYKVLVQQLYCIETLARVNVICLDKTGTLTKGTMSLKDIIPYKNHTKEEMESLLNDYANLSKDSNTTIMALKKAYKNETSTKLLKFLPFSSDRKFSGIETDKGAYYLGAPEILTKDKEAEYKDIIAPYQDIYRVLVFTKSPSLEQKPKDLEIIGFVIIEDVIRKEAKDTLEYFKSQGVETKIISGDSVNTVLSIARRVGLTDLKGIDVADLKDSELEKAATEYNIFGRVRPKQKRTIIRALKKAGKTVAMTGDGVNDVLALKESDCAISVASGSDAAKNVAQLILLDDNFASLPIVVKEGRQTINNIERSASLLLVKTIYTILLIFFSIIISSTYFFIPIQLTLITMFTIGIPSFILALEPNDDIVEGNFLLKVLARALPVALTVVFNVVLVTAFCKVFKLPASYRSSLSVFVTGVTGLIYLYQICTPFTVLRAALFVFMVLGFGYCFFFQGSLFELKEITSQTALIGLVLSIDSLYVMRKLQTAVTWIFHKFDKSIKVKT